MSCVEKLEHKKCGSSDGLQVYEQDGNYTAYCFACDTYEHDPYSDKPKGYKPKLVVRRREDKEKELLNIATLPTVALGRRGLTQEALDYYGVKMEMSQVDGVTPTKIYFPYEKLGVRGVSGCKARLLEEKVMWSIGDTKDVALFGWAQAVRSGARRLIICEGEYDAVALYQALRERSQGTRWEDYNPAVVSLTKGAASAVSDILSLGEPIRASFEEVVLAFDTDEAGEKATEDVCKAWPGALVAPIPGKDANECTLEGKSKALCKAVLFDAKEPDNGLLINAKDLFVEAAIRPEMGLDWPFPTLTRLTRGIRFGETYYIGAGVKMGKSDLCTITAVHLLKQYDMNVMLIKPEEDPAFTTKVAAGKSVGKVFTDPYIAWDKDAYNKATEILDDRLHLLRCYQQLRWEVCRGAIIKAIKQGCKAIFLDPITNLTNGIPSSEANIKLQEIAQDLAIITLDHKVVSFIFCHLNAPKDNLAHEMGGQIFSNQFAGSRAMMRSCHLMLGLEGNKDPNLPMEQRNKRDLVILEDRSFGVTGKIPLFFDEMTGLYTEL